MENQLFPQLGLKSSVIHVPENETANYAWGYDKENNPIRMNPGVFAAQAFGVKSTATDMIRYVQLNIDSSRLEGPMRQAIDGTHLGFFDVGDMVQGLGWQ